MGCWRISCASTRKVTASRSIAFWQTDFDFLTVLTYCIFNQANAVSLHAVLFSEALVQWGVAE
jgi:hypothetical protein